ncbi:ABC transporter permease [Leucobacter albus]|uniref:ABC transporter permease n=1 Tax=Leucobacter albus TaxID=272210 RepID=A0ABW3TP30_9MICO
MTTPTMTIPTQRKPLRLKRMRKRSAQAERSLFRILLRDKVGLAGGLIVVVVALAAVLAPLVAPYDPTAMSEWRLSSPNSVFLLGSDEAGRDLLSRSIYGARTSLTVSITVIACAAIIGVTLGLLAGYYRGLVDNIIMRFMDVLFAFPTLLLALAVVAALGTAIENLILALVIVFIPTFARIARSAAITLAQEPFVESARAIGARDSYIVFRYILPNALAPIAVQVTISLAYAILVEASLGYLGLGVQPPAASWGAMLASGKAFVEISIWPSLVPGVCIFITVLGFNLLGDALRDSLDPRLRSQA